MGILLKGGTVVDLEPAQVEVADLRVVEGRIVSRALAINAEPGDEVVELAGRVVLPGLVSAHHHLHATLLRGASRSGAGFAGELQALDRLESGMEPDEVHAGVAAGALEGLACGTTTVFDVHVTPKAVAGSLGRVGHAINDIGLRAVLAYEVSDRRGAVAREEALEEVASFSAKARGRFRGAVGLAHLGQASDETLQGVASLAQKLGLFTLINVAEEHEEEQASQKRFAKTPVQRLLEAGLVGERTVLSQLVHVSWPDLASLLPCGAWLAHAARGNMAMQTGLATPAKFGVRACLATDVMPLDVMGEVQAAWLRTRDSGLPIDPLRFLANGHRLATAAFGFEVGPLKEGAAADLVVYDAHGPTPLSAESLAAHVVSGQLTRHVESVMVDGVWRLWKRRPLAVDAAEITRAAVRAAGALWQRVPT